MRNMPRPRMDPAYIVSLAFIAAALIMMMGVGLVIVFAHPAVPVCH